MSGKTYHKSPLQLYQLLHCAPDEVPQVVEAFVIHLAVDPQDDFSEN